LKQFDRKINIQLTVVNVIEENAKIDVQVLLVPCLADFAVTYKTYLCIFQKAFITREIIEDKNTNI
jgi:hypothetical protein